MMESPRFDGTISLGNLLVVLTLVVSVVTAWTQNRARTLNNAAAIERLAADVDEVEARVRSLEIAIGRGPH
jgi:hypothetical protein